MSTFTSSAINKTGKTVAPKAVARRRAGGRPTPARPAEATDSTDAAGQTAVEVPATQEQHVARLVTPPPSAPIQQRPPTESPRITRSRVLPTPPSTQPTTTVNAVRQSELATTPASDPQPQSTPRRTRRRTSSSAQNETTAQAARDQLAGQKRRRTGAEAAISEAASEQPSFVVSEVGQTGQEAQPGPPTSDEQTLPDGTSSAASDVAAPLPSSEIAKSQPRRRKKAPISEATVSETIETSTAPQAVNAGTAEPAAKRPTKPRQPRKPRVPKPARSASAQASGDAANENPEEDDSETRVIDPNITTMTDLIREPTTGQVSEREKKMRQIDWVEVAKKRRESTTAAEEGQNGEASGTTEQPATQAPTPRRQQPTMQLRMVDGQIVLDEASQLIDRQAQALLDYDNAVVDENADLTKRVNRMTWINAKRRDPADRVPVYKMKTDPWSDEETDRFYDALRMFGTDFFIISKMFAPKTRRQIKLKFVREERLDPVRVDAALKGIVPMDLDHYAEATGVETSEFKNPTEVNEELEAQRRINDAEIEKRKEEANEAQKQKDIMYEQREREREERDREKAAQKASRDEIRRRKRRGFGVAGTGTF